MSNWKVTNGEQTWEKESRKAAEEAVKEFGGSMDLEIIPPESSTDGGAEIVAEEVEDMDTSEDKADAGDLQALSDKDITTDPLSVMPGHFVDTIQGVPTINRKGYCVLAEHFGISVKAEPVTLPSETGFEYAEFRAIAVTTDGTEYSGFGSAHVDRMDGDDAHLLAELAETRAMKRATAWATGIGISAYEEMVGEL